MVHARFTGENHYHNGERLEDGDEQDVPQRVVERWPHKFETLEDHDESSDAQEGGSPPDEGEGDEAEGNQPELPDEASEEAERSEEELQDLLDGNVGEIEDALESGDYDDSLDAIEVLEEQGEGRTTVQEAIEDRREG